MAKITKEQYEFALARIEELLPMVDDNTPANDRNAVELIQPLCWVFKQQKLTQKGPPLCHFTISFFVVPSL